MRLGISLLTGWATVTTVLAGPVSNDHSQPASGTTTTPSSLFGWDPLSLSHRQLKYIPPLPKHGWDVGDRLRHWEHPGFEAFWVAYALNMGLITSRLHQWSFSIIPYTRGRAGVLAQAVRRMRKYRLKWDEQRRYQDCATWMALQPNALELIDLVESICLRSAKDDKFTMEEMMEYYTARERPSPDPSAGPLGGGHDDRPHTPPPPPSPPSDDDPDPNRHQFTNGVTHLVHGMGPSFRKAAVALEKAVPFAYRTAARKGGAKAVDAVLFAGE
ncbi:MAG: hypothetical protein M1826_004684 [Phylliscum demangeonii]|nr:MAG: hypothetical protein M1826_004684 [Phylliscum demangeonii]